jgi:hypothetical protein
VIVLTDADTQPARGVRVRLPDGVELRTTPVHAGVLVGRGGAEPIEWGAEEAAAVIEAVRRWEADKAAELGRDGALVTGETPEPLR